MYDYFTCIVFLVLLTTVYCEVFRVCGAYCGPGWCNNQWIKESLCNDSVKPELDSCPDACCQLHDICCGHYANTSHCNKEIVDCLSSCSLFDSSCTYDGMGVPAFVIKDAMFVVENWCCGSPCSQ